MWKIGLIYSIVSLKLRGHYVFSGFLHYVQAKCEGCVCLPTLYNRYDMPRNMEPVDPSYSVPTYDSDLRTDEISPVMATASTAKPLLVDLGKQLEHWLASPLFFFIIIQNSMRVF